MPQEPSGGPESATLPRQEASQHKELREMSHGSTSVAKRQIDWTSTWHGPGKTIECTIHT